MPFHWRKQNWLLTKTETHSASEFLLSFQIYYHSRRVCLEKEFFINWFSPEANWLILPMMQANNEKASDHYNYLFFPWVNENCLLILISVPRHSSSLLLVFFTNSIHNIPLEGLCIVLESCVFCDSGSRVIIEEVISAGGGAWTKLLPSIKSSSSCLTFHFIRLLIKSSSQLKFRFTFSNCPKKIW